MLIVGMASFSWDWCSLIQPALGPESGPGWPYFIKRKPLGQYLIVTCLICVVVGSSNSPSDLRTPPVETLQATLEFDSHPIFGIITSPPSATPTSTFAPSVDGHAPSAVLEGDPASLHLPPLFPNSAPHHHHHPPSSATPPEAAPPVQQQQPGPPNSLPPLLPQPVEDKAEGKSERVKFVAKIDVPSEGIVCAFLYVCMYARHCLLKSHHLSPLAPNSWMMNYDMIT